MATGQTILNLMEVVFPELQLQSGEVDVTKGLVALNAGQDIFESLAAAEPKMLGGNVSSVTTTNNQEWTTFPSGLLRLDGLDFVDATSSLPTYPLHPKRMRGGHRYNKQWWWNFVSATANGKPTTYWTNGTRIYWDPIPDGAHTIRTYGFAAASDITAAGTFAYPDLMMLPLASLAVKVYRVGLDDPTTDLVGLAKDVLSSAMSLLSNFHRDGAHGMRYEYNHDT